MNVYYFSSLSDNQPKEVAWETVATEIRIDKLKDLCLRYRALLPEHDAAVADGDKEAAKEVKARMTALKNQCSAFMPQVTLDGGRARTNITGYRPFMIVDIDHIPPEQFQAVERMVKDDEHSRLAYVTISGRLGSDFVEDFHPFREWIERLPAWDGETDHIRKFFSLVHYEGVSCEEYHYYARCWFLAMVASVLDPKVVNHQILTFIGEQGTYKSSFMLHILPPHLRDYYATKNNSYQLDKDDYLMLAENIVISLEEIDSMTTKEVNQLKAFTTMPQVKERPPYGRHKVLMPRVALLTATGNNLTFLSDQTGNRRWLPFHVKCIDNPWTADIPYDGMYAQALALIRQGERYWLNDEDIHTLNTRNREFQTPDPAREMIVTYYMQPRTEAETKYMTSSKIAARFAPYMKISPRSIGMALNDLGFEQVRVHAGRFWKVAERPVAEIDSRIPDEKPDEMDFF